MPQHDSRFTDKYAMQCRPTHAVVPSVDLHVVHRADAGVVPDGVIALAWATDAWLRTLIDICAQSGTDRSRSVVLMNTV